MDKQERLNKVLLNNAVRNDYVGTARILLLSGKMENVNVNYLLTVAKSKEMVNLLMKYSAEAIA